MGKKHVQVPEGTWLDINNVIEACKKAGSMSNLHKMYRGAEESIRRNGWQSICYPYFEKQPKRRYSDSELIDVMSGFDNPTEFRKAHPNLYQQAHKRGLVGKRLSPDENGEIFHSWTKEECMSIASGYVYLDEFCKNEPKAMGAAKYNGWWNDVKALLKRKRHGAYTKEECIEEGKKYNTRNEYKIGSPGHYAATMNHGWKDEVCAHMPIQYHGPKAATYEECKERASKYDKKGDFQKYDVRYYARARHMGWIDEICQHMKPSKRPSKKVWSKEECAEEALKYNSRTEFRRNCQGGYGRAWQMGWLDEICAHMPVPMDITKRCIYAATFEDGYAYVGLTFNTQVRWGRELTDEDETIFKHIKESGLQPVFEQIHDYVDEEKAKQLEKKYIKQYEKDGWKMLNTMPGGSVGATRAMRSIKESLELLHTCSTLAEYRKKYNCSYNRLVKHGYKEYVHSILPPRCKHRSVDELVEIAKGYSYRKEMRKKDPATVQLINHRHIEHLAFAHMIDYQEEQSKPKTLDEFQKIANKYQYKLDFYEKDSSAYKAASKLGILDEICKHMKKGRRTTGAWSKDNAIKKAKRCSSKEEFKENYKREYNIAVRYGFLDDLFLD